MSAGTLRVRVFGGLEVWCGGRLWRGFETRKVAALFGYLVLNRDRPVTRGMLAALLWPEAGETQGRRNVRQALYMISTSMPRRGAKVPLLALDGESVSLNSEAGVWTDVAQFQELLGSDLHRIDTRSTHLLARAVQLYRGEILANLEVRDAPEFELWLLAEQERHRYLAIDALQALAASYLTRGEHRLGIQYARRLVAMDPLHEEGHRLLMALLASAGQRAGAIAHYRGLVATLQQELGARPAPQTEELCQRILTSLDEPAIRQPETNPRPFVPLVGRERELARLHESWEQVTSGHGRVTVIEGVLGTGKSRLVRSLLDELGRRSTARLVAVAAEPRRIQPPFTPLDAAMRSLIEEMGGAGEDPASRLTALERRALAAVVADPTRFEAPVDDASTLTIEHLAQGCAALARLAVAPKNGADAGLVLFLDDLHYAPSSALALVRELARLLAHDPVWLVGVCGAVPTRQLSAACDALRTVTVQEVFQLAPLGDDETSLIAAELVVEGDREEVARYLLQSSGGLPLCAVMQINLWWDEAVIRPAPGPGSGWALTHEGQLEGPGLGDPGTLARRRVARLSPFLRRLLTLGAILGNKFDGHLLAELEGESKDLVAAALESLRERWFLLSAARDWTSRWRDKRLTLNTLGASSLRYEFDHEVVRQAILSRVSPERRCAIHNLVAETIRRTDPSVEEEVVAHHHVESRDYPRALTAVRHALEHRLAMGVDPSCLTDLLRAEQVLVRVCRRPQRPLITHEPLSGPSS